MKNDIALRLKVSRRKAGLTQGDCAHLLAVHPSKISLMENGKVLPTVHEASILALVYGKPLDALLSGSLIEAQQGLSERLGTMPPCPRLWLGRFNRHYTLNALAVRLEALYAYEHGGAS